MLGQAKRKRIGCSTGVLPARETEQPGAPRQIHHRDGKRNIDMTETATRYISCFFLFGIDDVPFVEGRSSSF
jgi:hypothetical protein